MRLTLINIHLSLSLSLFLPFGFITEVSVTLAQPYPYFIFVIICEKLPRPLKSFKLLFFFFFFSALSLTYDHSNKKVWILHYNFTYLYHRNLDILLQKYMINYEKIFPSSLFLYIEKGIFFHILSYIFAIECQIPVFIPSTSLFVLTPILYTDTDSSLNTVEENQVSSKYLHRSTRGGELAIC